MNNTIKLTEDVPSNYNKFVIPPNNKPIVAKLGYHIFGFSDISELNMDFTLTY